MTLLPLKKAKNLLCKTYILLYLPSLLNVTHNCETKTELKTFCLPKTLKTKTIL